jgi:hypothetical protein
VSKRRVRKKSRRLCNILNIHITRERIDVDLNDSDSVGREIEREGKKRESETRANGRIQRKTGGRENRRKES